MDNSEETNSERTFSAKEINTIINQEFERFPQYQNIIVLHPDTATAIRCEQPHAEEWIMSIPRLVKRYSRRWHFQIVKPFITGRSSCCLECELGEGSPAVFKLAPPWSNIHREIYALKKWSGEAAPRVLAADESDGALLLERVFPGELFSDDQNDVEIIADLIRWL